MPDFAILYPLAGLTLIVGIGFAGWQYARARRAKRENERSALANPERG